MAVRCDITNRLIQATGQLASDKETIRAAAVFSLSRLYKESNENLDKTTIIDILSCFARENLKRPEPTYDFEFGYDEDEQYFNFIDSLDRVERFDSTCDINILLDCLLRLEKEHCDLNSVNITLYEYTKINLSNITLSNSLMGKSTFKGAMFDNINMESALCIYSYFQDTEIKNSNIMHVSFHNSRFLNCTVKNTNITDAKFYNAKFYKITISNNERHEQNGTVNFHYAEIIDCIFENIAVACSFINTRSIKDTKFINVALTEDSFRDANIINCKFSKCYYYKDNRKHFITEVFFTTAKDAKNISIQNGIISTLKEAIL